MKKVTNQKQNEKLSKVGLKMVTVNICNNFIVEYLLRMKVKVEKTNIKLFYTYNTAIESVRKYPLPIISFTQLKYLEGFGKFLSMEVAKIVQKHYKRERMSTTEEKINEQLEHQEALKKNLSKIRDGSGIEDDNHQFEDPEDIFEDLKVINIENNDEDDDLQSSNSSFSDLSNFMKFQDSESVGQNEKGFNKPKVNGEPFRVLKALLQLFADRRPATRQEINEKLVSSGYPKIKVWTTLKKRLLRGNYITVSQEDEKDELITITAAGKKIIKEAELREKFAGSGNRKKETQRITFFKRQELIQKSEKLCLVLNKRKYGSYKQYSEGVEIYVEDENSEKENQMKDQAEQVEDIKPKEDSIADSKILCSGKDDIISVKPIESLAVESEKAKESRMVTETKTKTRLQSQRSQKQKNELEESDSDRKSGFQLKSGRNSKMVLESASQEDEGYKNQRKPVTRGAKTRKSTRLNPNVEPQPENSEQKRPRRQTRNSKLQTIMKDNAIQDKKNSLRSKRNKNQQSQEIQESKIITKVQIKLQNQSAQNKIHNQENLEVKKIMKTKKKILRRRQPTNEEQFILDNLQKKGLKYVIKDIQLGDYVWLIGSKVYDCVVTVIQAQNFKDQEFKILCERLRYTFSSKLVIIFEYPSPSEKEKIVIPDQAQNNIKTLSLLARVDNFSLYKIRAGGEDLWKLLQKLHQELAERLAGVQNGSSNVWMMGSLEYYNRRNRFPIEKDSVRNQTYQFLSQIPSIQKKFLLVLLDRLPSLKIIYDKLDELTQKQKPEFLMWLTSEAKPNPSVCLAIVDFMFLRRYDSDPDNDDADQETYADRIVI